MDVLINLMGGESFHNVYIYQTVMLYTLTILQICQLYLNKVEKQIIENICFWETEFIHMNELLRSIWILKPRACISDENENEKAIYQTYFIKMNYSAVPMTMVVKLLGLLEDKPSKDTTGRMPGLGLPG